MLSPSLKLKMLGISSDQILVTKKTGKVFSSCSKGALPPQSLKQSSAEMFVLLVYVCNKWK